MSILTAYRVGSPAALWAWTPDQLGASLLAWWDAERSDLITESGGSVSSWKDIVGAYDLTQSIGASRPTYGATSFNGRAGVTPDGTDDYLELASGLGWVPAGAAPSEDWYVVDQTALVADGVTHELGSWGSTANSNSRRAFRSVVSAANRAGSTIAAVTVSNTTVDFSGRHVVRVITTATNLTVEVDGVASSSSAVVPATVASRVRMFANSSASPTLFGKCVLSARFITGALSVGQANQLYTYLNRRL